MCASEVEAASEIEGMRESARDRSRVEGMGEREGRGREGVDASEVEAAGEVGCMREWARARSRAWGTVS